MATFVRTVATPGSYYIGIDDVRRGPARSNKDKLADLGLHGTEALVVGELVAGVIKGTVGRQRPSVLPRNSGSYELFRGFDDGDNFRSFPSGHSTSAFAAAAAVTSETSRLVAGHAVDHRAGALHRGRAHRRLADVQQPALDERRARRRGDRYLRRPQGRTLSPLASGQPARPVAAERLALAGAGRRTGAPLVDHARACRIHFHHAPPLSLRHRVVRHA